MEPYDKGYQAKLNGEPISSNPFDKYGTDYEQDAINHVIWNDGWNDAPVREYKQSDRYESLFWIDGKLVGRVSRDRLGACLTMMSHNMELKRFDGIAVYDCGEYYASSGIIGAYEYGPPFSPTQTKEMI